MTTTFQRESVELVHDDIEPLLRDHHDETAVFGEEYPLRPDWRAYEAVEKAGALRVYTARDAEERLLGYSVVYVTKSMHRQVLEANEDLLYVRKAFRGTTIGVRLMRYVEAELRSEGVELFARRSKAREGLSIGRMLEQMGYTPTETIYFRQLKDECHG